MVDVQYIEPRENTDSIHLGNHVVIRFEGEEEDESFTLLGQHDSGTNRSWISYKSPIGKVMLHKKRSDLIEYAVNEKKYLLKL